MAQLVDDLALALDALTLEAPTRVRLVPDATGKLALARLVDDSSPAPSDQTSVEFALVGARRLVELVHGNEVHKAEAIRRRALDALVAAAGRHVAVLSLHVAALKAVRSVTFKNEEGRARAGTACIYASMILRGAVDGLRVAAGLGALPDSIVRKAGGGATQPEGSEVVVEGEGAAGGDESAPAPGASEGGGVVPSSVGGGPGAVPISSTSAFASPPLIVIGEGGETSVAVLSLVSEALTTITALVNRHEINAAIVTSYGVPSSLQGLLESVATSGDPAAIDARNKATFLSMMLQ